MTLSATLHHKLFTCLVVTGKILPAVIYFQTMVIPCIVDWTIASVGVYIQILIFHAQ
jgi:hypothetical protein